MFYHPIYCLFSLCKEEPPTGNMYSCWTVVHSLDLPCWADNVCFLFSGGVVLSPTCYGRPGHTNTMIHELGHILGLFHVFKGVSEKESCDDPCRETIPSMETGDLCEDTAPTVNSKVCRDPDPVNDTCGQVRYSGTPFNNYMSYTGRCLDLVRSCNIGVGMLFCNFTKYWLGFGHTIGRMG